MGIPGCPTQAHSMPDSGGIGSDWSVIAQEPGDDEEGGEYCERRKQGYSLLLRPSETIAWVDCAWK
jgi:hypothetical protein